MDEDITPEELQRQAEELGVNLEDAKALADKHDLSVVEVLRALDLAQTLDEDGDPYEETTQALKDDKARRDKAWEEIRPARKRVRNRLPRGFVRDEDGSLSHEGEPRPEPGEKFARPAPAKRGKLGVGCTTDGWMLMKLRSLVDRVAAGTGRVNDLEQVRRAYVAAFCPPEVEWQVRLSELVERALRYRLSQRAEVDVEWVGGTEIVIAVRMTSPPGTVPLGLTGLAVEELIGRSTLTRGGGRGGGRVGYQTAVNELIRSLGQDPYQAE